MPNNFKAGQPLTRKYCPTQNANEITFEKPLMLSTLPSISNTIQIWKNWLPSLLGRKTNRCLLSRRTHLRKRISDNSSFLLDLLTESINLESCENGNTSQKHIFSFQEQIIIRKVSVLFSPKESTLRVSYNLETTATIVCQKRYPTHTTATRSINYLESESILHRILWLNLPN